jgi:cytochrome P450
MSAAELSANFLDAETILDPFPLYEQIRAEGRVVWNGAMGMWMVPGFDDCLSILTDAGDTFTMMTADPEYIFWFEAPNMIQVDGPEHTRLRRCLSPLFTRNAVAKWEARVAEVVDELLRPLAAGASSFDIIADFTMIPTVIVAEMLGVPKERHLDFRRWSHAIVSNHAYGHEDSAGLEIMRRASDELNAYLNDEIDRHRRERPDDLITAMLAMPDMTEEEARSTAILLLIAGYDTTAKLMANCLVALEQHPDQRRLVAEDHSLVPAAIEEVLRWSSVAQVGPRRVMRETVIADTKLATGDVVGALLAAANRDPARWPEPGRFDVRRDAKSHLGLGFGPHLCLGAPLARLETKVALERLLALAPEYRLRDTDYGNAFFTRGLEAGTLEPVHGLLT